MERFLELHIETEDLPCTVEKLLRLKLHLTKKQISQAKFRKGGITLNGQQVRVTQVLKPPVENTAMDDVAAIPGNGMDPTPLILRVLLEEEETGEVLEECRIMPEVLYEDEDLLVVNKPAGLAVHPAHGHYADTLANQVQYYYRKKGIRTAVRPVGRLDADTSGIMLFAKNAVAVARLQGHGSAGEHYEKTYYCLAWGLVQDQTIDTPIRKAANVLNKMEVVSCDALVNMDEQGSECTNTEHADAERTTSALMRALTHVHVRECFDEYSLCEVTIETGRTHQIRVHMAGIGHPLLGDPIYGCLEGQEYVKAQKDLKRAALHCGELKLRQPITGEILEIQAPLPEDMRRRMAEKP